MDEVTLQLHFNGQWYTAACYRRDRFLAYDIDYAAEFMHDNMPMARVGLNFDINFEEYSRNEWPAFLFDLIPAGAARDAWLAKHNVLETGDRETDWTLLCFAANCPPGNLRIASAVEHTPIIKHPGFSRDEIVERNIDFIEYAAANGAMVAGASSVQGQAPKFLLVQDLKGRWHAEGALPEEIIQNHWIVKFPRGRTGEDRMVLRNEAPYYEVAREFGLKVGPALHYGDNALFIERFDRTIVNAKVLRFGLESATSICKWSGYGPGITNNQICEAMKKLLDNPKPAVLEFLRRDILNLALGNVDNHGRNTAILKTPWETTISPLFDFAPMFLDPEGIPRAARWEQETPMKLPDWGKVAESLSYSGLEANEVRNHLKLDISRVKSLPDVMQRCGVELDIINRLARRIDDLAVNLRDTL